MILIITSFFPYQYRENWISPEINSLSCLDDFCILARTSSGDKTHSLPKNVREIKEPLIGFSGLFQCIKNFRDFPWLIKLVYSHSNDLVDFIKRLSVVPKALASAKKAKDMGVSHVHVHNTTTAATLGLVIAKILGVGFSFTVHTSAQFHEKFRRNYTGLIEHCQIVRTISDLTNAQLRDYVIGDYDVHTVRMGVDLDINTNFSINRNFEAPRILMAAALEDYKGIDNAILAINDLVKDFPNIRVDIFGEGTKRNMLEDLVFANQLERVIKFHGVIHHNELLEIMADSDVYNYLLLTSNKNAKGQVEGIPVILMEAMASGLLPIAVDNGAVRELLDDSCSVIIDDPFPASISSNLKNAFAMSSQEKQLMAEKGRQIVVKKYNAKKNASILYNILSS